MGINHSWFDEINQHPVWNNAYVYDNHSVNCIPTNPLQKQQYSGPQFHHLNHSYASLNMPYKNEGIFCNPVEQSKQQLWANSNDLAGHSRAIMAIDYNLHSQVNDHQHDHYHSLQTVGILFNGPANNDQTNQQRVHGGITRNDTRLIGQAQMLQQHPLNQALLRQSGFHKTLSSSVQGEETSSNQNVDESRINIYANSNWKNPHIVDDGGLATLPRRPSSSQSFHPYNNEKQLASNYNPHFMSRSKMNLSQSSSSVIGMPGLSPYIL